MKLAAQLWRAARLFGSTFGHAAWVTVVVHASPATKAAVLAAAVGATEAAYRQVVPNAALSTWVKDLKDAYRIAVAVRETKAQAGK